MIGLSGLAYLAQGWIAGVEGFSSAQSVAIVLGWAFTLVWMLWLAVVAWYVEPVQRARRDLASGDVAASA